MKIKRALYLFPAIAMLALASFQASAKDCPLGSQDYRHLLSEGGPIAGAFIHLKGFESVRNHVNEWERKGLRICASGVVLGLNDYRYPLNFLQLEVYSSSGEMEAHLPLRYQSASVQAHHNYTKRPRVILNSEKVGRHFKTLITESRGESEATYSEFPEPGSEAFSIWLKDQPWFQGSGDELAHVMPLVEERSDERQYLLAARLIPVHQGSLYTTQYSLQARLLELSDGGKVLTVFKINGFYDVKKPLSQTF